MRPLSPSGGPALDLADHRRLVVAVLDAEVVRLSRSISGWNGDRAAERERSVLPSSPPGRRGDDEARDSSRDFPIPGSPARNTIWPCRARRSLEAVPERRHLALAPDERRQSPFGLDLEPAARARERATTCHARTGAALPLSDNMPSGSDVEVGRRSAAASSRRHDRARVRRLLESRRDVRRVADGRVVHPQVVPDAADHDKPGVQPLTHLEADSPAVLELLPVAVERSPDGRAPRTRRAGRGPRVRSARRTAP